MSKSVNLSILIPCNNDESEVRASLSHLLTTIPQEGVEVIIGNDGSVNPNNSRKNLFFDDLGQKNIRVLNLFPRRGVGYALDRCAEASIGKNIVILGADVKPLAGWYEKVTNYLVSNPNTLGCAVSIGDRHKHYGANLLVQMGYEDLPKHKQVPENKNFTALFRAKWRECADTEPTEIPCVLGAFYWTSREFFMRTGGWDTKAGKRFYGHAFWGALEPHISLKYWLSGGRCVLYPDIEARHSYGRITRANKYEKRAYHPDFQFFNQLWIAETMIFNEAIRKQVIGFKKPELNFGIAQKYIRKYYTNVLEARKSNEERFVHSFEWYLDKFGIVLK